MHGGDIYNNIVDIDFSVNLNPYGTPGLKRIIGEAVREGIALANAYPDIAQSAVRSAIADSERIDSGCVVAGNGASELIMAVAGMCAPKRALLVEPCYSGYEYALKAAGCSDIKRYYVQEDDGFVLTADVLDAITPEEDMIFLADPANPTGQNIDNDLLAGILEKSCDENITVVLDNSFYMLSDKYLQCTGENMADWIQKYPNLFIIVSYTKCFALPGIRMGYAVSSSNNVSRLREHLPEWNLSSVSSALMCSLSAVADDGGFYRNSISMIQHERAFLTERLSETGLKPFESNTNFILFKGQQDIYEKLLEDRIMIRKCLDYNGLDERFYRTAVRCREDNIRLADSLAGIVRKNG